jgi:hypothetical protein
MLTRKQNRRSSRHMSQVGELRPPYLHDGMSSISGSDRSSGPRRKNRPTSGSRETVHVRLEYEKDPETGETRRVQK